MLPEFVMTLHHKSKKKSALNAVLPFVFSHLRSHPWRAAMVCAGLIGETVADVFMPLFAGHLVDALALGVTDREAAEHGALVAFGVIVALGFAAIVLRFVGLQ